ncbi:hypothetical protein [Cyclobacterium plantarum]|uniref:hypothetical protein n=1 Tax=Cyclobacterium plantarum TaxID=2716263 RepID=UPI003F713891
MAIITTGSHSSIPMCLLGKIARVKIIWILSYARMNSRAFSADIIYPIADKCIIQWPGVKKYYKKRNLRWRDLLILIIMFLGTFPTPFERPLAEINRVCRIGVIQERVIVQSGHTQFES